MNIIFPLIIILALSIVWAWHSSKKELEVPREVKKLKFTDKKKLSGVIMFLKDSIIHYQEKN